MTAQHKKSSLSGLTLAAVGIVYGDIGTSPLYTLKTIFDPEHGLVLTTPNLLEARANRVMMENAKTTVIVCDSSKFGRRSLSFIAPTSSVQHTITDKKISPRHLRGLRAAHIKVITV